MALALVLLVVSFARDVRTLELAKVENSGIKDTEIENEDVKTAAEPVRAAKRLALSELRIDLTEPRKELSHSLN